jgi:hypothetical protein
MSADEEIMKLATQDHTAEDEPKEPVEKPEGDDTLELGGDEAPKATAEEVEADKEKKARSHHPIQRINTLTARLREAERRAAEAEARAAPQADTAPQAPDPNKYEFGEADPQYIKDSAVFEVRKEFEDQQKKAAETAKANAAQNELVSKLNTGVQSIEKTGPEKYDDFEEVVRGAAEARGEPLNPIVSIGIAVSPVGADLAYHLAKDEATTDKLETLFQTKPQQGAIMLGELEGQYLESDDDSDLDPSDPLDLARMIGRERARRKGLSAQKPVEVKTSKAPKTTEHQARGATGQFEVSDDTTDFKAFERKYMGKAA